MALILDQTANTPVLVGNVLSQFVKSSHAFIDYWSYHCQK